MKMGAYYNEFDPFAAAWLRELIAAGHIADGDVDTRSIVDVQPDDVDPRGDASRAFPITDETVRNRVGLLKGYGNAIVPQVAAAFVSAFDSVSHPGRMTRPMVEVGEW